MGNSSWHADNGIVALQGGGVRGRIWQAEEHMARFISNEYCMVTGQAWRQCEGMVQCVPAKASKKHTANMIYTKKNVLASKNN